MWEEIVTELMSTVAISVSRRFYRCLKIALNKEFSVPDLVKALENGQIAFYQRFYVTGLFSEFVPFVDFSTFVTGVSTDKSVGTCRLGDLINNGKYLGALYPLNTENAKTPAVPLIYSSTDKSGKLFLYSTGDQLRLECMLVPLDYEFRYFIHKTDYFCFKDKPFALKVINVNKKIDNKVDSFTIDAFLLSSLNYPTGNSRYYGALNLIASKTLHIQGPSPIILSVLINQSVLDGELKKYIETVDGTPIQYIMPHDADGEKLGKMSDNGEVVKPNRDLENKKLVCYMDAVGPDIYRSFRPIDVINKEATTKALSDLISHFHGFTFVDRPEEKEWAYYRLLLQGKNKQAQILASTLVFHPNNNQAILLSKSFKNHRSELVTAWDFFKKPIINCDFQFDQMDPILKQTINVRSVLKSYNVV